MPDSDDPFLPYDPTQRPRPGAGRRGAPDPPLARPPAPHPLEIEPLSPSEAAGLGIGLNPLVQAASPLLVLSGRIRGRSSSMDVTSLRRHALEEIGRFEDQARASGVRNEIVLAARYALCAGLDEAVLSTPWGAQSDWAARPLLVALHREAWGGEKFFEVLERITADPARHIDLMELQYLILALGFTGKYGVGGDHQRLDRRHEQLMDLRQELYRKIRAQRGPAGSELSRRWRGLEDRRNRLVRYVPWWVVGAAALAVLAVTFAVDYSRLATQAAPIHAGLSKVGVEAFSAPPPPAPVSGPTLKQLLAPQEAAGTMTVEENGGRTVVTLLGGPLFASGSAAVDPSFTPTLQHLAAALNRVPGRVLVVGHTDDQPIRSLQFHDNFELSRERAVSVATILKQALDNSARVTWRGVGASEPRYRPESDPENRARNRRVEVVHVSGM